MNRENQKRWLLLAFAVLLVSFFPLLFYMDNKYQMPPPYGKDGELILNEEDFSLNTPLFLIDGWLLRDERTEPFPTYIGEFSSLQRGNPTVSPHGKAVYQITLRYEGKPVDAVMSFPYPFSRHTITLAGTVLSQQSGDARISFLLTEGNHRLTVETVSSAGYYSGMYRSPVLGNTGSIFRMVLIQS